MTRAAVLYVFRVMVDDDIPMNAGCLRPIRVILPEGSMLSPRYPAAVVAGNVEVSQAVTDTLFAALGALGSAPGHDEQSDLRRRRPISTTRRSAPARRPAQNFDGAAAVHTHMTNSRLTDPEVLESRFPVVLEDFHIRRGSGGKGRWKRRRRHAAAHPVPEADACRDPQRPSRRPQSRARWAASPANSAAIPSAATTDGSRFLPGCAQTEVEAGEAVEIVTPTGGGWGKP